jgi:hypothetical protein
MRIVYISFPTGQIAGGQKMIARHVESLRELGFDAVWWRKRDVELPWLRHAAPVEVQTPFRPDDILVVPSDAPNAIASAAKTDNPVVVFVQGHITFASTGGLEAVSALRDPTFLAVSPTTAAAVRRAFPSSRIEIVPGFADERLFRPPEQKRHAITHAPWKRALEAAAIRAFLKVHHPRHARTGWATILNATEEQMAEGLRGYTVFLSLSRLEGLGLTPLEAMASGCLVAGFKGLGGCDFATADNGFWVDDDDCIGAADALAEAADLALAGGPALARRLEAGRATAEAWSYARFRTSLEEVWMRIAPEARVLSSMA